MLMLHTYVIQQQQRIRPGRTFASFLFIIYIYILSKLIKILFYVIIIIMIGQIILIFKGEEEQESLY